MEIVEKFEFEGRKYEVVYDDNIEAAEHCGYCHFDELCNKFIDTHNDLACHATFHPNKQYVAYSL